MLVCGRDPQFVMLHDLLISALEHINVTVGPSGTTHLATKAHADAEKLVKGQEWIQPALLLLDMIAQPLLVDKTTLQSTMGELERNTIFGNHRDIYVPPDLPNVCRPWDTVETTGLIGFGENATDKTQVDQSVASDKVVEGM